MFFVSFLFFINIIAFRINESDTLKFAKAEGPVLSEIPLYTDVKIYIYIF